MTKPTLVDSNNPPALTLDEWLEREIAEPDYLLGELLTTTSRALIVGPTGLGKTMFGIAVAIAIASNAGFLHWTAGRKIRRVLYIDGEMSSRLLKQRLREEVARSGLKPASFMALSKEDFQAMLPLNTRDGQRWLDSFMRQHGGFDLLIFDNIQALIDGDHSKEESWSPVLDWMKTLTKRSIAQIWFHHTGHSEDRGFGTKTREWQMDTVGLMQRAGEDEKELAFSLKFTKARERTPDNRADFEPVTMKLVNNQWVHSEGKASSEEECADRQRAPGA